MPRTKKPIKIKSKRNKEPTGKGVFSPWGGCMVSPPKDCERQFRAEDGCRWVDIPICTFYCDNFKTCKRAQWYNKATMKERRKDLIRRGVQQGIKPHKY